MTKLKLSTNCQQSGNAHHIRPIRLREYQDFLIHVWDLPSSGGNRLSLTLRGTGHAALSRSRYCSRKIAQLASFQQEGQYGWINVAIKDVSEYPETRWVDYELRGSDMIKWLALAPKPSSLEGVDPLLKALLSIDTSAAIKEG